MNISRPLLIFALFSCASAAFSQTSGEGNTFELKSNDTIVFVGNTFVERAQRYGHIETALELAAGPDVTGLKFRNLGWSGDSVFGDARSYFGEPQEGRDRLDKGIAELKPNVVFICYGTGAAMTPDKSWTLDPTEAPKLENTSDDAGLAIFKEGYLKLIERVKNAAGDQLREIVLVSPPPLENLGAPWPNQIENNQRLAKYCSAIGEMANPPTSRFLDLFGGLNGSNFTGEVANPPLTDNGIHYGNAGYEKIASIFVSDLGLKMPDGLVDDATQEKVTALRTAITKKNRTFFHRWRPANETYLFLFRKHEQGNNAKEIPMFDPIIAEQEAEVTKLRAAVFEAAKKR